MYLIITCRQDSSFYCDFIEPKVPVAYWWNLEEVMENGEAEDEVVVIQHAKVKMLNIFLLGLCFCFLFTGFSTMSQNQVLIFLPISLLLSDTYL